MENEIEEAVRGMTPGFPIKATEQIRVLLITECKRERERERAGMGRTTSSNQNTLHLRCLGTVLAKTSLRDGPRDSEAQRN